MERLKPILVGKYSTSEEVLREMQLRGSRMSEAAVRAIQETTPTAAKIEVAKVSARSLGMPDGASRTQIYKVAFDQGLRLIPQEAVAEIHLEYLDQPTREWLTVATDPFITKEGLLLLAIEYHIDSPWIITLPGDPEHVWGEDDIWLFME